MWLIYAPVFPGEWEAVGLHSPQELGDMWQGVEEELMEFWRTLALLILSPDTTASETVRGANVAIIFICSHERENGDKKTFGTMQYSFGVFLPSALAIFCPLILYVCVYSISRCPNCAVHAVSLTHKVIAKECCDCKLNLTNLTPAFMHSSVTISLLSSLPGIGFWIHSEGVILNILVLFSPAWWLAESIL